MMPLSSFIKKISVNPAIFYALSSRGWQLFAGPVTLFFIAHFFSANQQGFYYTFTSILLLQIFFEMGLSYVLIQFVSHEFAYLRWTKWGAVSGGFKIKRFKQLVLKSCHWYLVVSLLFILFVMPAGWYFLGLKSTAEVNFSWRLPWALLVLATAINLLLTPLLAIIEGSGKVQDIYRLRFAQTMLGTVISWIVILVGGGLYCAASIAIANALLSMGWLFFKKPLLLRWVYSVTAFKINAQHSLFCWWTEVWPMQWRIAISWMSGYFINQIFVPILFLYQSPVVAGQMGMSLAISVMIIFTGQAWLSAKAPFMGRLIAEKNWPSLDKMFFRLVWQSSVMVLLCALGMVLVVCIGQHYVIFQRLLPPSQMALLAASALLSHWINCIAQYLRSHKRDPFMVLSVLGAVLITGAAWYFGKSYSSYGIVASVFCINLCYGLPTAIWFWVKYRRVWQAKMV